MAQRKRSSLSSDGAGPSQPSKKPKSTSRFAENTTGLSRLELEAMVTQLQAENKELREKLSVSQQPIGANQTRSEPVPDGQYKIRIFGTIEERIFTGSDVIGHDEKLLKVVMYCNNDKVTWEPFASAKFEILVVEGESCLNDRESWSADEFQVSLVKAQKNVGTILNGPCISKFINGKRDLDGLKFKDNSSRAEGRKWRLGIRALGSFNVRVLEAISEPFRVLDRHGKDQTTGAQHNQVTVNSISCNSNDQLLDTKTNADENARPDDNTIQHYNLIQDQVAGVHDRQQFGVDTVFFYSDDQLLDTETDVVQNDRPDHSTVLHYNFIQDETSSLVVVQEGCAVALLSTAHLNPTYMDDGCLEGYMGSQAALRNTLRDNSFSPDDLLCTTIPNTFSLADSDAEVAQFMKELAVQKRYSLLKGGLAALRLFQHVRKRRAG